MFDPYAPSTSNPLGTLPVPRPRERPLVTGGFSGLRKRRIVSVHESAAPAPRPEVQRKHRPRVTDSRSFMSSTDDFQRWGMPDSPRTTAGLGAVALCPHGKCNNFFRVFGIALQIIGLAVAGIIFYCLPTQISNSAFDKVSDLGYVIAASFSMCLVGKLFFIAAMPSFCRAASTARDRSYYGLLFVLIGFVILSTCTYGWASMWHRTFEHTWDPGTASYDLTTIRQLSYTMGFGFHSAAVGYILAADLFDCDGWNELKLAGVWTAIVGTIFGGIFLYLFGEYTRYGNTDLDGTYAILTGICLHLWAIGMFTTYSASCFDPVRKSRLQPRENRAHESCCC